VVGEEDMKVGGVAAAMAARMQRAQVAIIPQAGHAAHVDNPAAFNARVLRFLTEESLAKATEQRATSVA